MSKVNKLRLPTGVRADVKNAIDSMHINKVPFPKALKQMVKEEMAVEPEKTALIAKHAQENEQYASLELPDSNPMTEAIYTMVKGIHEQMAITRAAKGGGS